MSIIFLISANYIHICHEKDPNLKSCMLESIETLRSRLKQGIPELHAPSIDPIVLGDLIVSERTQSNGLRLSAQKIRAFGASGFKLTKFEYV